LLFNLYFFFDTHTCCFIFYTSGLVGAFFFFLVPLEKLLSGEVWLPCCRAAAASHLLFNVTALLRWVEILEGQVEEASSLGQPVVDQAWQWSEALRVFERCSWALVASVVNIISMRWWREHGAGTGTRVVSVCKIRG
jgi:hypothetical protein